VRERKLVVRSIAQQLVDAGVLNKEQIRNPSYYATKSSTTPRPDGNGLLWNCLRSALSQVGKENGLEDGHQRQSSGSRVRLAAQGLTDVATAKTIDYIKQSEHNVRDEYRPAGERPQRRELAN